MSFLDFISFKIIPLLTGENKKPNVYITNINFLNWLQLKKSIKKSIPYIKGKCADIGSGHSPYKKYILNNIEEYISIDKGNIHTHMFSSSKEKFIDADIKELPFENNSFDTVILTQVLEHIDNPFKALEEIKRVLKKDGILILSVPFIYQAHATPYDFYRFSEYGLKEICKNYDFKILEFHYQGYLGTTIFSIINGFIWEVSSKNKLLRNTILLPFLFFIFSCNNLLGLLLDKIKLKNYCPNFWLILKVNK
ncbi:methyltransferase type 11 [Malaciobacter mytili]|uniref:class I SAM-dependent methyltransferase n=1 Tax=Malaciobacter mytili TaxID=603050 RepID=UPI00100BA120|nr:class I SAM-dependent methyltransferase [Malaciobacter mytili]RXI40518.1 methyltransferase type 11 [Malaciobacter mytili]